MNYKIVTKFCFIFFLLTLVSCGIHFRPSWKAPSGKFVKDIENASPDFRKGWQDGCETGMASGTNSFNQMFYKQNKQDGWKMATSPEYKTAWNNAFWYCYRSDYVDQKSTPFSSFFKGYQ